MAGFEGIIDREHLDDIEHSISLLTEFVLSLTEKDEFCQVLK